MLRDCGISWVFAFIFVFHVQVSKQEVKKVVSAKWTSYQLYQFALIIFVNYVLITVFILKIKPIM